MSVSAEPSRPTFDDVRAAAARIAPHVRRTPVHTSTTLDARLGLRVFFKCENFQRVGAFKARGATNTVLSLDDDRATRGVITHSSGNHAAALAFAARIRGIPCAVVMPRDTPPIKIDAVRGYGAEIVFCDRSEREDVCAREQERRGSVFVHPYEDPRVIAGQGTAALELLDEVPDLELLVAPVGGGGLLAGSCISAGARGRVPVWGAEPQAVDDAFRSLEAGVRQPGVSDPVTWADGLMTGLGRVNFEILRDYGVRVVTMTEAEMLDAARFLMQRLKLVVEPSAATVLAALEKSRGELSGMRVGAILSGGNTDFAWLGAD